jgi:hypothetical protein
VTGRIETTKKIAKKKKKGATVNGAGENSARRSNARHRIATSRRIEAMKNT